MCKKHWEDYIGYICSESLNYSNRFGYTGDILVLENQFQNVSQESADFSAISLLLDLLLGRKKILIKLTLVLAYVIGILTF